MSDENKNPNDSSSGLLGYLKNAFEHPIDTLHSDVNQVYKVAHEIAQVPHEINNGVQTVRKGFHTAARLAHEAEDGLHSVVGAVKNGAAALKTGGLLNTIEHGAEEGLKGLEHAGKSILNFILMLFEKAGEWLSKFMHSDSVHQFGSGDHQEFTRGMNRVAEQHLGRPHHMGGMRPCFD